MPEAIQCPYAQIARFPRRAFEPFLLAVNVPRCPRLQSGTRQRCGVSDLMYYFNTGYGSEVSGSIDFPWFNALMGLLDSPSNDIDQDLYVSFTHRQLPPAVLFAVRLFNNSELTGSDNVNATMPLDSINYGRRWVSSNILPFLTNVAVERINCSEAQGYRNATAPTFYQVLLNNSPQTLPDCFDGPLESCFPAGMRRLVLERANMFGDFGNICEVDYRNSTDVLSIHSRNLTGQAV